MSSGSFGTARDTSSNISDRMVEAVKDVTNATGQAETQGSGQAGSTLWPLDEPLSKG